MNRDINSFSVDVCAGPSVNGCSNPHVMTFRSWPNKCGISFAHRATFKGLFINFGNSLGMSVLFCIKRSLGTACPRGHPGAVRNRRRGDL